jgi:hypothetical protein
MIKLLATSASLVMLLGTASANAQGYPNTGFGYFNSSEGAVAALKGQVEAGRQANVQGIYNRLARIMQDPAVQAQYQQYRAQGGPMNYQQYAYQWAMTGGFRPGGAADAYRALNAETARVQGSWQGEQYAEAERGAAQGQMQQNYADNEQETGNLLEGRSTWSDPQTGMTYQLPHAMSQSPQYDPQTNRYFRMDDRGTYYVSTPNGSWEQLEPYQ